MSKHTPGPWRVSTDSRTDEEGLTYVSGLNIESDAGEIVGCEGIEAWKDNAEANARLIASAPDLLEALQWFVLPINNKAHNAARAAIAKATGGEA